jgi:twitching motility protein PilJ
MADKSQKSSAFTTLALLAALLLLAAAALAWLRSTSADAADPGLARVAALSQSIPLQASRVQSGDPAAIAALRDDLRNLAAARGNLTPPGSRADWDALDSHGAAIVARGDALQALASAAAEVRSQTTDLLAASEAVLSVSGATGPIQRFQQTAAELADAVAGLTFSSNPQQAAAGIAAKLASLRALTDALGGATSALDVAPIAAADRELLAPMETALQAIESSTTTAIATSNVSAIAGLQSDTRALHAAAGKLRAALMAAAPAASGGLLSHPYLIPGLLLAALLLVIIMAVLHSRSAVFERAAKVQAEQNERNQQAILRLLDELGSLADGDLSVEATVTEDITGAIADSINYAIEKLRELVATINETAIMVDSAAKQTESTAVHMARAAENQNREIAAATESIVSMAGSIEEVSGNAERSSDVARHSVDVAHKGGEAVRRTIDGMNTIRETIQDTSKRIKRLGESSQEIGNIVELINDIAEQTNILALNASIQASMAGEAGRGFAVVADEVQRLAERSTNATKQIEVLVRTIQADTNEAVVSMERSTTDVVGGALLAENAGAALDEIEQVSNQIASLVQNISGSARQQASSAADVTRRTKKLKEISSQTGKATTATAAAISKLSELASQLRKTVAGFTLPGAATPASGGGNTAEAQRASKEKAAG